MHEPRFKNALGVGYSVSPTGADHCHNMHDVAYTNEAGPEVVDTAAQWGVLGPVEHSGMSAKKTRLFTYHLMWRSLQNCVGLCQFVVWRPNRVTELINAVTGWNSTLFELMKVGERMETLCRAFNVRERFTVADDSLPRRMFRPFADPKPTNTPLSREEWEEAKRVYYAQMGWDESGVPTDEKLEELNLGWVVDEMKQAQLVPAR
jgi:aldehyde:ferredoxin oxidoreductase